MKKSVTVLMLITAVMIMACSAGKGEAEEKGNTMMMSSSAVKFYDLKGLGPSVVMFDGENSAMKAASKGTAVYFFAATWCPTCRAAYEDIRENAKMFPSDYTLIFVNYDTQKDLIKKYGVSYQHTFVRIDEKGKAVKIWSGSRTVKDIVKQSGMM